MRKWMAVLLVIYGVVAIILVTAEKDETGIAHVAGPLPVSRVISRVEESVRLPFYTSDREHYIYDKENITSSSLHADELSLTVDVEIVETSGRMMTEAGSCRGMAFELTFRNIRPEGALMTFVDPILEVSYVNGDVIRFRIQDLSLYFKTIESSPHLDFRRMHPLMVSQEGTEYLGGFYLELIKQTDDVVVLKDISMLLEACRPDMSGIEETDGSPGIHPGPESSRIWAAQGTSPDRGQPFPVTEETTHLLIPLTYRGKIVPPSRFPLLITYEVNDETHTWVIDDYLFYSPSHPTSWEEKYAVIQYLET